MRQWNAGLSALFFFSWMAIDVSQAAPPPGDLINRCPWTGLDVVSGRIRLVRARVGQQATLKAEDPDSGAQQVLTFSARTAESASLRYEYQAPEQELFVTVEWIDQIVIESRPRGNSGIARVRYRQPHSGPLKLAVDDGSESLEVVADSFWHLMLAEPDLCRVHLLPILQNLRTDWRLDDRAAKVELALWAAAHSHAPPGTERMGELVKQLNNRSFNKRQAADYQLRSMGQTAVAFLRALDVNALNAEQRSRIQRILASLRVTDGDTPDRVAAWLSNDKEVWLTLLAHSEAEQRTVAAERLAAIINEPLRFDPTAEAALRQQQIGRLRTELGLEQSVRVSSKSGQTQQR